MKKRKAVRRGSNSDVKKNRKISAEHVGRSIDGGIATAKPEGGRRNIARGAVGLAARDPERLQQSLGDAFTAASSATSPSVDLEQFSAKTTSELVALVNIYHQVANEARSRLREAISSQQNLLKKVADLEENYSLEMRKSSSLEQSVRERFAELAILEKKIAELDALLEWEKSKSVKSVSAKSSTYDFEQNKLEALVSHWEERYESLSRENEGIRTVLTNVSRERDALLQKVERMDRERVEFNATLGRLNKSIFDKDELLRREIAARLDAEKEIERLKNTISWKVTWPIRMIPSKKKVKGGKPQLDPTLISLVRDSGYFDSEWYVSKHPEVETSGMDALNYFCARGLRENHDPGPHFSCDAYRKKYSDVARSGMPAFLHFVVHGRAEGRRI
ncbi:hypothetical protein QZM91_23510 [Burkholderia multivorans]|uniref:hypothetical protein n=1 Tax=Burkholderia multivorans TaxID=87883 RepID=UPI0021C199B3|nr:hypothetical protein [Burkholderia multivorans]MDN7970520.1 hypothetical protein [Burkholderia multivorans]